MSLPLWYCLAAILLASCQGSPARSHRTSCDELGGHLAFDPELAVGTWTTVYSWEHPGTTRSYKENVTFTKLTPLQIEEYQDVLEDTNPSSMKFYMSVHDVDEPLILDAYSVLDVKDNSGNVVVYPIRSKNNSFSMKLKQIHGFLVLMYCDQRTVYMLAKPGCSESDKVHTAVEDLHIEGVIGTTINPY